MAWSSDYKRDRPARVCADLSLERAEVVEPCRRDGGRLAELKDNVLELGKPDLTRVALVGSAVNQNGEHALVVEGNAGRERLTPDIKELSERKHLLVRRDNVDHSRGVMSVHPRKARAVGEEASVVEAPRLPDANAGRHSDRDSIDVYAHVHVDVVFGQVRTKARHAVHDLPLTQVHDRCVQVGRVRVGRRCGRGTARGEQHAGQQRAGELHATVRSSSAWPTEVADVEAMTTMRSVVVASGTVRVARPVVASVGMPAVQRADLPASVTASESPGPPPPHRPPKLPIPTSELEPLVARRPGVKNLPPIDAWSTSLYDDMIAS